LSGRPDNDIVIGYGTNCRIHTSIDNAIDTGVVLMPPPDGQSFQVLTLTLLSTLRLMSTLTVVSAIRYCFAIGPAIVVDIGIGVSGGPAGCINIGIPHLARVSMLTLGI
jgi:hypothetical protein